MHRLKREEIVRDGVWIRADMHSIIRDIVGYYYDITFAFPGIITASSIVIDRMEEQTKIGCV